jgi:predicted nucleic acid-binding protein
VPVDPRTIEGAWLLQDRYSLAWWDALIVSAAQIAGCRQLLTEDLSHGQDLDGVRVVDPFRVEPGEIGA